MTEFACSVCFSKDRIITMVNGTVICKVCLEKVAEQNKNNDNTLKEDLKNAIIKDDDIYD